MSTFDSYAYTMAREAQRRAEAGLRQRELEQKNASLAALLYASSLASSAQHQSRVESVVREQTRVLAAIDHRLAASAARINEIASAAERAERLAATIRESISQTQAALQQTMARAAALEASLGVEGSLLRASLADARTNLETIERESHASAAFADLIVDGVRRGSADQRALDATLARLGNLNRELDFVVRDGVYNSAAMATLMAMQENGYELQEVMSGAELTSIFAKKDSERRIEIRLAKVGVAKSEHDLWKLMAETLDMKGEECLAEIDDFTTVLVDELRLGTLKRDSRQYPKHDTERERGKGTRKRQKETQHGR